MKNEWIGDWVLPKLGPFNMEVIFLIEKVG